MSENDFMVAIQAILTQARDDGWPIERIVDAAHEAVQEFVDVEEEAGPNARGEGDDDGEVVP
jgi:hypothetical protein